MANKTIGGCVRTPCPDAFCRYNDWIKNLCRLRSRVHPFSNCVDRQGREVSTLLTKHNMLGANVVSTPISSNMSFKLHDGALPADPTKYWQVIGSIQYLSLTRLDISFAVNKLSQFMHRLSTTHWSVVKRILWYLKGTIHLGLFLWKHSPLTLYAFADADWAGNSNNRTFPLAYVVFLRCKPISWSSKKQKIVAWSSTKVEYWVVATTATEINWVQNLLYELHAQSSSTPTIYCDNVGTTYACANLVFHSRMKHIAIDFHFVRD